VTASPCPTNAVRALVPLLTSPDVNALGRLYRARVRPFPRSPPGSPWPPMRDDRPVVLLRERVFPADSVALLCLANGLNDAAPVCFGRCTTLRGYLLETADATAALGDGQSGRLRCGARRATRITRLDPLGLRSSRPRVVQVIGQVDVRRDPAGGCGALAERPVVGPSTPSCRQPDGWTCNAPSPRLRRRKKTGKLP